MPKQFGFAYQENDYFSFALSNQMRSDAIFAVWHQGKDEYVERIEREIRNGLMGTNSLINGIRERLTESGNSLFAWPPKFKLPSAFDHRHPPSRGWRSWPATSRSWATWASAERRMAPLAERLLDGETLRLTYLADDRFRLDPSQQDVRLEEETFPNWIVTEESEEGNIARLSFDDYVWKDRMYAPNNLPIALAGVKAIGDPEDSAGGVLRLDVKPGAFPAAQAGRALPPGAAVHRLQRR